MKYGKFEIKKVVMNDAMAQETMCFSLDLYVDGKKFASVSNDGRGGCHRTRPYQPFTHGDIDRVEERMAEDDFLVGDTKHERFDMAVNNMLLLRDAAAQLRKLFKDKAVFVIGSKVYSQTYPDKRAPDERLFAAVKAKHPDATVLNTMTFEAAAKSVVEADKAALAEQMEQYAAQRPIAPRP